MFRESIVGLTAALLAATVVAKGDPVLEWNEIMVSKIAEMPPTLHTRLGAMMHLAIHEAVSAVDGGHQQSSIRAAVVAAAHGVLRPAFPDDVAELDAMRDRSLARIPYGTGKMRGIAAGKAAAASIIARRANDGSEAEEFHLPVSANPGEWQLTAGCPPQGGVFPHWTKVTPFTLRSADQFRSVPPPALTSHRYARAFEEVKQSGGRDSTTRPPDRTEVARMYDIVGDGILWNPIARQLAEAAHRSPVENARTFALLNVALADAAIAVLETKYHYDTWRPETAVPAAATDNNDRTAPDAAFVPLISTPCFPGYPSGHAALRYAAREVVEHDFGPRGHALVVTHPQLPQIRLEYSTLEEMTSDIDDARVYGGIHFRFDQTAGAEQGRRVGAYVLAQSACAECVSFCGPAASNWAGRSGRCSRQECGPDSPGVRAPPPRNPPREPPR